MFGARTVGDVRLDFEESEEPSCEPSNGAGKVWYLFESIVISAYSETISFEVQAKTDHEPYNC